MTAQEALRQIEENEQKKLTANEAFLMAEREESQRLSAKDALSLIEEKDNSAPTMPYQAERGQVGLFETPQRYLQPGFPYAKRPGLYEYPEELQSPGSLKPQTPLGILGQKQIERPMPMPFSPISAEMGEALPAYLMSTGRQASKLIPPVHSYIENLMKEIPEKTYKEIFDKHPIAQQLGKATGMAGEYAALIYVGQHLGLFGAGAGITSGLISKGVPTGAAAFLGGGTPGGIIFSTATALENLSDVMTGKKKPDTQTLLWEPAKSYAFGQLLFGGQVAGGAKTAMGLGGTTYGTKTLAPYVEKMWRGEKPEWKNLAVEMPISVGLGMLVGYWGHEANADAYMKAVKNQMVTKSADFIQAHSDIINKDPGSFMFATKTPEGTRVTWGLDATSQEIIRLGNADLSKRENAIELARAAVDHFFAHPSPTIKADFSGMSNMIHKYPELIANMTADINDGLSPTSALIKQTFAKMMDVPLHPAEAGREALAKIDEKIIDKVSWERFIEGLTQKDRDEFLKINEQAAIPRATNQQKAIAHGLQKRQGLSREVFNKLKTDLTGVESMADMDEKQAQALIDAMRGKKSKEPAVPQKREPAFKKPTLAQWPTSKFTYAQVLGLEDGMKDLFVAEINRTLESAKINKFADDVTRQLKKQASLGDKLASRIKARPTKPEQWMSELLMTYGDVEELPPIDAQNQKIFKDIRDLTRSLRDRENAVREVLGREPIREIKAYLPLVFDQITKAVLREAGTLSIEDDPLKKYKDLDIPDDAREWLRPRMPRKPFNPTEFERQHREELRKYFTKDLNRLIKWLGHYATREIWLSEPLELFKEYLEHQASTGALPQETKDWAEAVVKYDIFKYPTPGETALKESVQPITDLINKVLHPLNRHLSNPMGSLMHNTRKVVMTSALGGRPKMPTRNTLQRGLLLNLFPAKHFVKAQLGMGIPKEIKQQLRDTWLYRMEKRFEDYPEFKHHITEWLMMPYQLSHAGLWLGKVPLSNVDVSMATGWLAGEELRTNPRYIKWAKNLAIKRGLPENTYLRTPQDSIDEAMRAAFLTQWLYHPLFMPQIFRGQILRTFASLTSWQQFLWFTHNRELLHVLFKGESWEGKPYPPYYRMRAILGYATLLGTLEGIRKASGLNYTRFYLGPQITIFNPMARLGLGAIMYATARNDYDRSYGKWLIKSSRDIFIPYGIGASEWQRWMTGEISTKEFLTFTEKKPKGLAGVFKK